jgi:hypothetical protein
MRDDRTDRGFKLPYRDNDLQTDVGRLRDAITAIDGAFGDAEDAVSGEAAAVMTAMRGAAGGIAPLDGSSKIPAANLPDGLEKTANKNAASGYAGLGSDGKLSGSLLPDGLENTASKNAANGYAGLGADGKLADGILPSGIEKTANKGAVSGYAGLGSDGKVPSAQLPDVLLKSGGTMTGALTAQNNANYTTAQARNVTMGTDELTPGASALANGQMHLVYE